MVVAFGVLPIAIAGVVLTGEVGTVTVAFTVGALAAGVAYAAVFLLLAVVTRNAVVIGLIYALIWESLVGGLVPGAQTLSIQQWSLAVVQQVLGDSAVRLGVGVAVGFGTGLVLLVVVTVAATCTPGGGCRRCASTTSLSASPRKDERPMGNPTDGLRRLAPDGDPAVRWRWRTTRVRRPAASGPGSRPRAGARGCWPPRTTTAVGGRRLLAQVDVDDVHAAPPDVAGARAGPPGGAPRLRAAVGLAGPVAGAGDLHRPACWCG